MHTAARTMGWVDSYAITDTLRGTIVHNATATMRIRSATVSAVIMTMRQRPWNITSSMPVKASHIQVQYVPEGKVIIVKHRTIA